MDASAQTPLISEDVLVSAARRLKEVVVGIDLGTTFSLAAYMEGGRPQVVRDEKGDALVPSVVSFTESGKVLVGWEARARSLLDPQNTIYSVKRLIGRGRDDLQRELSLLPYAIENAERKLVRIRIRENRLTPQEVSAMILKEVKRRAERALEGPITRAVITVPAYFDDAQRQATRDAGRIAGLDVLRIINEPTAASLAYGLDQKKNKGIVAVYDLGGGTFDISVLRLAGGVFQVLSTLGDTFLGGDDFDRRLMDLAAREIREKHGLDVLEHPRLLQALRDTAEKAKIILSKETSAPMVLQSEDPPIDYARTLTRTEMEGRIGDLVQRTLDFCCTAVHDAGLTMGRIDEVVLVGGSTRIPLVRRRVEEVFGRPPHTDLNPDEVVALGAAVQAQILSGGFQDMMVLDVTPLSLGIETFGGAMSKLILRNTPIPCRKSESFTTFVEGQTSVDIHVLQGEREMARDCRSLGKWKLRGIPPMAAGMPRLSVTFTLDANGVLTVNAREERSGQELNVEVAPSSGLTPEEVERLVKESIDHAREDVRTRQKVELRNEVDSIRRHTERALSQAGERCPAELRRSIESGLRTLTASAESDADLHELEQAIDRFNEISLPLARLLMDEVAQATLKDKKLSEI
ncbi:MAG: molecular chaperone DnaK [Planctomycetes bacterium]|nr:molecular chaperone DnaK [Planctomycetota bacterium]